jgi:hypothetical protein
MQTAPTNSPDESVRATEGANVNINRITLPPARDLIMGTLLAVSILCNVFLFEYARDAKTQAWLAEDQIDKFMTNQYPSLLTRIEVTEALVNAYGMKNQPKPEGESNERRSHHQSK